MAGFSERSGSYKFSILCLALGFPCLAFGFGYPSWSQYEILGITILAGLWQLCTEKLEACTVYAVGEQEAWFEAVRGIVAVSILLYIITLIVALKQACSPPPNMAPEGHTVIVLSLITGGVAMAGIIVYGAKINLGLFGSFSISYWVSMVGSGASFAAGFLLSVNRRSFRGGIVQPLPTRHGPPPYGRPPGGHPSVIGGPMLPGYPPGPGAPQPPGYTPQPPGYTMTHGLSPGYPPREGYNQGYPGPPPAYNSLPGQPQGVGAWPAGNSGVPPVYNEDTIKQ